MRNSDFGLKQTFQFFVAGFPFLFSTYLLKFKLFGIPFTVLEVCIYLLFAFWLLLLLFRKCEWKSDHKTKWILGLMFLLFFGVTLGAVLAPSFISLPHGEIVDSRRIAFGVWKGWVFAPMLYFILLYQTLRTEDMLKRIAGGFVFSSALLALVSYGFAWLSDGVTYDFRLRGFFESANYLSLALTPALLLGISLYFIRHKHPDVFEILNILACALLLHALFFTQSYAALLSVFGAIGLFLFILLLRSSESFKRVSLWVGLMLGIFGLTLFFLHDTPKFRQFVDFSGRSSSTVRLEIYEVAWNLIQSHPIVGIGPGLFQPYYQNAAPYVLHHPPLEWNIPHPHNVYMAFYLNAGLLGLLAFLGLVVLAHRRFHVFLLPLWGILIHGLFDTSFWKNDLSLIFWLVLSIALYQASKK